MLLYSSILITSLLNAAAFSSSYELKIVGGLTVQNRSDFPYQVSLQYKNYHFCGGAIIDHFFIITAAHCSFDSSTNKQWNTKYLRVVAGELNLKIRSVYTVTRNVARIIIHPMYSSKFTTNDIALWEVSSPFLWTNFVSPVGIVDKKLREFTPCNVSGWGVTDYAKQLSPSFLQFVEVPITPSGKCRQIYPEYDYKNVLCAGIAGKDSCQGDSGGALVCNGSLTGIVSYGIMCGIYPGIYTDVYAYRKWIKTNTIPAASSSNSRNFIHILQFSMLISVMIR